MPSIARYFDYELLLHDWSAQVRQSCRTLQHLQLNIFRHPLRFQLREHIVAHIVLIVTARLGNFVGINNVDLNELSFQLFFLSRHMRNKLNRAMHGNG